MPYYPPASGGAGVTDGDKGDITVSGSGATWTIDDDSVTYAKIQNVVANNAILGNNAGAGGIVDELTATEVRTLLNVADGATANTGNVVGPASSTDNSIARYNGTTGKTLQDSSVTVLDNGNVGLGTTNPAVALEIQNGHVNVGGTFSNPNSWQKTIRVQGSINSALRAVGGPVSGMLRVNSGTNPQVAFGSETDHNFAIFTNGHINYKLTITKTGNVGIGTINPSAKLDVIGNAEINGNITVTGTVDGVDIATVVPSKVTGPASATDNSLARYDGTTGKILQNSSVTVLDDGNVGIGTTSPASKHTVAGDAEVTGSANGVILASPNGTRWRVQVANDGSLSTTAI